MRVAAHPVLYEINARVWLREFANTGRQGPSLMEVPSEELDRLVKLGIDFVWLMGVWPCGPRGIATALSFPDLQEEYEKALPDFEPPDVTGSPYSIAGYSVDPSLGGVEGLKSLRVRLARRGIGLVLDFVANHTGLDHSWVLERPDLFVPGRLEDLASEPPSFFEARTRLGPRILAYGRDPYFPAWTDTAQLDLRHRRTREALNSVLAQLAEQCDGVRCDMAMLSLESVFHGIWERRPPATPADPATGEFWQEAIRRVRATHPDFLFIAEAYWGLEGQLRGQGFDYTYDKTLYERLVRERAPEIRAHLAADPEGQKRSVHFLENHDEPRAAATLAWDRHQAAAIIATTSPGMVLLHEGQLEGRRVKLPIQLRRRPYEPLDEEIAGFYRRLLEVLQDPVLRRGRWELLEVRPAWADNPTWEHFIAYKWQVESSIVRLITVNFGKTAGQCLVDLGPVEDPARTFQLRDLLGSAHYLREGAELAAKGLYLDMPAFGFHFFEVAPQPREALAKSA